MRTPIPAWFIFVPLGEKLRAKCTTDFSDCEKSCLPGDCPTAKKLTVYDEDHLAIAR